MNICKLIITLVIFSTGSICTAQNQPDHYANAFKQLQERGEVYFRFSCTETSVPTDLLQAISPDHGQGSEWITAYASKAGFESFLDYGYPYEILTPPSLLVKPRMKSEIDLRTVTDWDFYPTYEAYVDLMYQFADEYPDLCTVVSIGQSEMGRELLVARISDNATHDDGEAQFLYTSSMHGDETAGYVLMLHLIDYLLTNYGTNIQVTNLVDNLDIWINPLANPDGTYFSGNNTVFGSTRFNANNVDLNRNYADPDDGPHPDNNEYQVETEAFMAMAEANRFVIAANFHGGAEVFNYPWDTWSHLHADTDWWEFVGREWADTAQFYSPPGYMDDLDNGVTNGYAWYTTTGSRQDYMNYYHHCREVTLEISSSKTLPENMLSDYWEYNYRSFLHYMEQALFGFRGTVTDEQTGAPVQASVVIEGHDEDNSWVASNPSDGWFFRPIIAGSYELTFFAPGYEPKVLSGLEAINRMETNLEVQLKPTDSAVPKQLFHKMFSTGPNPVESYFNLIYKSNEPTQTRMLIAGAGGKVLMNKSTLFDHQGQTYQLNLEKLPSGEYLLIINTSRFTYSIQLIRP